MSQENDFFSRFARFAAKQAGKPFIFGFAVLIIILWAMTGPVFQYSDTWQLVINTGTTVITFLMVFLIQNTQNRDSEAMHLKLDELIRSSSAHNALLDIEELSQKQLDQIKVEYEKLAREARPELEAEVTPATPSAKIRKQPAPGARAKKKPPIKKKITPISRKPMRRR